MEQATQKRNLRPTMFYDPILPIRLTFILGRNESSEPFLTGEQVEIVQYNNQIILLSGKDQNLPVSLDFPLGQKVQKWNGEETSDFNRRLEYSKWRFGVVTGNQTRDQNSNDVNHSATLRMNQITMFLQSLPLGLVTEIILLGCRSFLKTLH